MISLLPLQYLMSRFLQPRSGALSLHHHGKGAILYCHSMSLYNTVNICCWVVLICAQQNLSQYFSHRKEIEKFISTGIKFRGRLCASLKDSTLCIIPGGKFGKNTNLKRPCLNWTRCIEFGSHWWTFLKFTLSRMVRLGKSGQKREKGATLAQGWQNSI